jgi:uncharacterized protein (DUF4415 family)
MKKGSEKQTVVCKQPAGELTAEQLDELKNLAGLPDAKIDCSDAPELDNWNEAVIGKFYRPVKQTITIRLDADVVSWLKNGGKGYQSRANAILRQVMNQQGQPRKAA